MKYCIIGCRFNGTTSLEKYFEGRGLEVIRDEGFFEIPHGPAKFTTHHKGYRPVIIISDKKREQWENILGGWTRLNPVLVKLEEIIKNPNFPHELGKRHD